MKVNEYIWPLIKPTLSTLEEDSIPTHELFFFEVCSGFESSAEWNEAIFRVKKISKNRQKELRISFDDLFLCVIEFCKLHNEKYEHRLDYTLLFLESMKNSPNDHKLEWSLWKDAIIDVTHKHKIVYFNWDDNLA